MNRKLTQLRGLAEEWKYLGRRTGMSPYSYTHTKFQPNLCSFCWPAPPLLTSQKQALLLVLEETLSGNYP